MTRSKTSRSFRSRGLCPGCPWSRCWSTVTTRTASSTARSRTGTLRSIRTTFRRRSFGLGLDRVHLGEGSAGKRPAQPSLGRSIRGICLLALDAGHAFSVRTPDRVPLSPDRVNELPMRSEGRKKQQPSVGCPRFGCRGIRIVRITGFPDIVDDFLSIGTERTRRVCAQSFLEPDHL